ncbi:hypothetical protein CYMTET_9399 [Cymbomonas tetramitiformis]|uniref:Uncharacterized protein n=1 Tax=Cymbomonas tetramitiformis TaxID=36881 RepID=A0AAE0LF62_9CHLO|nr:hypothetical protein CYMTET_9399 [Cymbomonas tetramitiformis]
MGGELPPGCRQAHHLGPPTASDHPLWPREPAPVADLLSPALDFPLPSLAELVKLAVGEQMEARVAARVEGVELAVDPVEGDELVVAGELVKLQVAEWVASVGGGRGATYRERESVSTVAPRHSTPWPLR